MEAPRFWVISRAKLPVEFEPVPIYWATTPFLANIYFKVNNKKTRKRLNLETRKIGFTYFSIIIRICLITFSM